MDKLSVFLFRCLFTFELVKYDTVDPCRIVQGVYLFMQSTLEGIVKCVTIVAENINRYLYSNHVIRVCGMTDDAKTCD